MEKVNENEQKYRGGDSGPKYLFRGPLLDWGVILLKSGQTLGPHYHEQVEETFYFLEGGPIMRVNGEDHRVAVGDAFRLDPGDTHDIVNDTDADARLVFIKTPYLPDDKVSADG